MIPHILGNDSLTVFVKGKPFTINKDSHIYPIVIEALSEGDEAAVEDALNIRKKIISKFESTGKVKIEGNSIFCGDREITGLIKSRVFEMLRLNLDITPMVLFIENLMSNPSKRAVDELFGFLEACRLPITSDGHFLAYKRVRADYKDCHSGTMDNSVGKVLEMPRNMVDEDKNNTCSYGLHFCSYDYLSHFGGDRIVVLKINPADVVAIPADYNNSKGRTCRYEVVDELSLNDYKLPTAQITNDFTDEYESLDNEESEADEFVFLDEDDEVPSNFVTGAKLTEEDVVQFRKLQQRGWNVQELAAMYDISLRQAKRIFNNESWKWVKVVV